MTRNTDEGDRGVEGQGGLDLPLSGAISACWDVNVHPSQAALVRHLEFYCFVKSKYGKQKIGQTERDGGLRGGLRPGQTGTHPLTIKQDAAGGREASVAAEGAGAERRGGRPQSSESNQTKK